MQESGKQNTGRQDMEAGFISQPLLPPDLERIFARIHSWGRMYPDLVSVEQCAESGQGYPVLALVITDKSVSDRDKEVVMMTGLHCGAEQSGAISLLYMIKWLLSPDPEAREILRQQKLVCLPVVNPDGYRNLWSVTGYDNLDPYTDWTLDGPLVPEKMPEAMAVKRLMDEYQPEVHADWHGGAYSYQGIAMMESTGCAYSNIAVRPYHRRIIYMMDEAALAEGYPCDLFEEDAEEMLAGSEPQLLADKIWRARPGKIYAATYAYNRFHTMTLASEVRWERSGLLRHQRLLRIGNEIWPGEYHAGYPVRVVLRNIMHMLVCYGETAEERRRSRVELWNSRGLFSQAENIPNINGMIMHIATIGSVAGKHWLSNPDLRELAAKVERDPRFEAAAIGDFIEALPGASDNRNTLWIQPGRPEGPDKPIEHGLAARIRLPYAGAKIRDVRLNGHPLSESPRDGYTVVSARGYTWLQVNYPPQATRQEDVFVLTCRYDPAPGREALFEEIFND